MKNLATPDDLRPAPYNPRRISPEALAGLKASIASFGDISGIVWNSRTGHLVAGHQRMQSLRSLYGAALKIEGDPPRLALPTGEAFPIRVVDWDDPTEKAANIAARQSSGPISRQASSSTMQSATPLGPSAPPPRAAQMRSGPR